MRRMRALFVAAMAIVTVVLPVLAQEAKPEPAPEPAPAPAPARKILLKEKYEAGWTITHEQEDFTSDNIVNTHGERTTQRFTEITEKTGSTIQILEVSTDGEITKARVSWPTSTSTSRTRTSRDAALSDPVELEGRKKGAQVLWSWDAEKKALTPVLEKGDADKSGLGSYLKRVRPFHHIMVPNREVTVGESWSPSKDDIEQEFFTPHGVTFSSATYTCKAVEVVVFNGVECLNVEYEFEITGEKKDEQNTMVATFQVTGTLVWDIANSRALSNSSSGTAEFSASGTSPDGKKTSAVGTMERIEAESFSYSKTEPKPEPEAKPDPAPKPEGERK